MRLITFIIIATISLLTSTIRAYSPPPGSWQEWPKPGDLPADLYRSIQVIPDNRIWRRGDESIRWALFPLPHKVDDAHSLLLNLRRPSGLPEKKGPLKLSIERRCSGNAWWVTWTVAELHFRARVQKYLYFERGGREALIQYTYRRDQAPDSRVLQSMQAYCATFNR